jgi:hypothetical protein
LKKQRGSLKLKKTLGFDAYKLLMSNKQQNRKETKENAEKL